MNEEQQKQALEAFSAAWDKENTPEAFANSYCFRESAQHWWLAAWEARGRASGQQVGEDFLRTMRAINVDRCVNGFKHALDYWSIMEWGCAIGGESGELLNVLKKIQREKQGLPGSRLGVAAVEEVGKEIADIVLYCDLLAAQFGIDLAEAITNKFNATSAKLGVPHVLAASPQVTGKK